MKEIRWHGRGGQGAKTVSQLLAVALLAEGHYVQAFPEYGPERSGAPVQAYDRIDDKPIRLHCAVTNPSLAVVLDESLLAEIPVTKGLPEDGLLLINSPAEASRVGERLGFGGRIITVPGDRLAEAAGTRFANVVLLGAVAQVLSEPSLETLVQATQDGMSKLSKAAKEASIRAIRSGYKALDTRRKAHA